MGYGFSTSYLLRIFGITRSSYYRRKKPMFFLKKTKPGRRRNYCLKTNGEKFEDKELEKLLKGIYSRVNPYEPEYYLKVLGSKKLSKYFLNEFGIIVNHKKVHRMRKKLGYVRKYWPKQHHPVRRSTQHEIDRTGILWEADIKYITTIQEGNIALLDIIDVYSREIVGSYLGKSCKCKDFTRTLGRAMLYQETVPQLVRTDNGSLFTANYTREYFEKNEIIQEFGIKHHPDSQAFIESQHSNVQREFVAMNVFERAEDVHRKYQVYMDFYHNLRPHGSLKYMTPQAFKKQCNISLIQSVKA